MVELNVVVDGAADDAEVLSTAAVVAAAVVATAASVVSSSNAPVVVEGIVAVVDVAVVFVVFAVKVEVVAGHAPSPGMQSEAPLQALPILCGATSTL